MPEPIEPTRSGTPEAPTQPDSDAIFGGRAVPNPQRLSLAPIVIAAVAVLILIAVLVGIGRRHGGTAGAANAVQPVASYAPQLQLGDLQLSESTSFSGGKETFVDGRITNGGPATVTGVTVQVLFGSEGGTSPQMETVPVSLIRARQPYIDTQPVSAAPLAPGATADFRLTFDDIKPEWNQQPPEIRVTGVTTR